MFRRCVRDLTSVRSLARSHPRSSQIPYVLSARSAFSTSAPSNPSPKVSPSGDEKKSGGGGGGGSFGGLLLGGVLLGGSGALAYNYGYFDSFLKDAKAPVHDAVDKNTQRVSDAKTDLSELKSEKAIPFESVEPNAEKPAPTEAEQPAPPHSVERETVIPEPELRPVVQSDESISTEESVQEEVLQDRPVVPDVKPVQPESVTQDTESKDPEAVLANRNTADGGEFEKNEQVADEPAAISREVEEAGASDDMPPEDTANKMQKDSVDTETQPLKSLAELYSLEEDNLEDTAKENIESPNVTSSGNYDEKKVVVVDVVEAIRSAERQQAEADAYVFAEEKRRLKEKYERELKDARALLVKKAEEVAMLERELNKEKAKAVATIKGLQEKAQQKLQEELQQKEEEARKQLEKVQELAKAELAAAISMEKASQIEKIAEAELNINALCMAFYARSEEARQSHSVHNLALATLRIEDALSEGLPLRGEVDSLRKSLEGIDKDTLLSLALSSLPEEALDYGTDTPMDLSIKFNALKGTLRRFSLIPANGGGLLTHAVARLASSLKIKEDDESGEGVESLITRVENLLGNGKLAEAADALEIGSRGSQAEEAVTQWVRQVRARAIAEQTLSLLQSYASSITFS